MKPVTPASANTPLRNLEEWEDFLKERYPEPTTSAFQAVDPEKKKEQFRNYEADARPSVREFYRLNHHLQTYDVVQAKNHDAAVAMIQGGWAQFAPLVLPPLTLAGVFWLARSWRAAAMEHSP